MSEAETKAALSGPLTACGLSPDDVLGSLANLRKASGLLICWEAVTALRCEGLCVLSRITDVAAALALQWSSQCRSVPGFLMHVVQGRACCCVPLCGAGRVCIVVGCCAHSNKYYAARNGALVSPAAVLPDQPRMTPAVHLPLYRCCTASVLPLYICRCTAPRLYCRKDEQFQEAIADPHVQHAIEELRNPGADADK